MCVCVCVCERARPEHGGDRGKRASDSTALSPGRVAEPNEIHHANVRAMGGTSQSSKQSTNGDEDNDASPEQVNIRPIDSHSVQSETFDAAARTAG